MLQTNYLDLSGKAAVALTEPKELLIILFTIELRGLCIPCELPRISFIRTWPWYSSRFVPPTHSIPHYSEATRTKEE